MGQVYEKKINEEETLIANKCMKRFSTSLVIRGKPIKPTMIQHFIPISLAKIIKSENIQ